MDLKLSRVRVGKTFMIGDVSYIKIADINGITIAMTKDIVFQSRFGHNNNLAESEVLERLENEFLPAIVANVGDENVLSFTTDLTTFDGLKPYEPLVSKISLPTLDFYRKYVEILDDYKINKWWWLATPESAVPHSESKWILVVAPSGRLNNGYLIEYGVRPVLNFVSSIFVSCEE